MKRDATVFASVGVVVPTRAGSMPRRLAPEQG